MITYGQQNNSPLLKNRKLATCPFKNGFCGVGVEYVIFVCKFLRNRKRYFNLQYILIAVFYTQPALKI